MARYFQEVIWQCCQVHYQRDALKQVPAGERAALAARLHDLFNAPDWKSAQQRLHPFLDFHQWVLINSVVYRQVGKNEIPFAIDVDAILSSL